MKAALTVIAFLMAAVSLSLHFIGFYSPLKLDLFPITVQSAVAPVVVKPSDAYINVQSAVAPVHVEPGVLKIENIVKPAKVDVWCPY